MGCTALDKEQEYAYLSIFEAAPEALVVVGEDGRQLAANRSAREIGVDTDALLDAAAAGGSESLLRVTDRKGDARVFQIVERRLHGMQLFALRDVTDRRALEEALSHSKWIESLGYVTASVVHDFNNLLTPILCTSSLLVQEVDEGTALASMASELNLAAERAAGLVRQLMRLVKRQPATTARVNVNDVIGEAKPLIAKGLPEDVDLAFHFEEGSLDVVLERQRLETALLNVVANARDAMRQGGTLTITTGTVTLREGDPFAPSGTPPGEYVSIAVADTGEGMPPEVRRRAFDRFFTTKGADRGTGLGLPAVQSFAGQSGGWVALESESGKGTTVVLHLPRAAAAAVQKVPEKEAKALGGSETILVVEDDELVLRAVSRVLRQHGYRVFETNSATAALDRLGERPDIDLAIVDVVMPQMNGRELIDRVRSIGGGGPRVLFLSGHVDDTLADRRGPLGGREHTLRKAFSVNELLATVRRAIDGD